MIRTALLIVAVAALVLLAGFALWVRLVPMDPAVWHADPETAEGTGRPNEYRVAVDVAGAPEDVLARFEAVALAAPRTVRIAGGPAEGRATYVQRSALMGYPDAVSVKAEPSGGGTRLHVWSRSRYGQSDLGVNAARVERWLAAM